jgi:hypothetical protein
VGVFTKWIDDRLHIRGQISGADGVAVESAILRLSALAPKHPETGGYRDPATRAGEALVQMASQSLAADADHDRATIVVHVSAEELVSGNGPGWDAASRLFSRDDLQRLACDSRIQPAIDDSNGVTIGVGRTTRTIAPWLRRIVEGRDQGCRFPGCGRTRWLHCHHLKPWSDGGTTNLDNLLSLCGFHHRLIHRGWTIRGNPNGRLTFINQWNRPHVPARREHPQAWTKTVLECIEHKANFQLAELANSPP